MSTPTYCQPHGQIEPCPACEVAAQYDGDLLTPPAAPEPFHEMTTRFLEYHRANPHVLAAILDVLRETWQAGVRKLGMQCLVEVVRWRLTLSAAADAPRGAQEIRGEKFGIPNDHAAYYARLLRHMHPVLATFFVFKACEADNREAEWCAAAVEITKETNR